ncbi:hypothetical protein [Staphylothermus hellenicus]|uniref:Uncharacterized protein n=1 Tax=Staphylothermus hellenicus (strain DSM 12710 / JCM 10830 / BK20S6-10-b1 / P8) TaxID=591019 RepID=D7D921_STAHD|nr:hypothetical protein [Staphylothermus hellenicus]ADI32267.1 hypothetical protein Shell_1167 [Staphylothermus hellenicus DSM 12710]
MRIAFLISTRQLTDAVNNIIKKYLDNNELFIITSKELVKDLANVLDRKIIEKVNIIVLKLRTEENALRLFSQTSPDIVIDCDPIDYFKEIKRIIKFSHALVQKCVIE